MRIPIVYNVAELPEQAVIHSIRKVSGMLLRDGMATLGGFVFLKSIVALQRSVLHGNNQIRTLVLIDSHSGKPDVLLCQNFIYQTPLINVGRVIRIRGFINDNPACRAEHILHILSQRVL